MAGVAQANRARRDASGGPWDATIPTGPGQFAAIQAIAPSLRVEVSTMNIRDAGEIERAIAAFARSPNGGLIVTAGASAVQLHRDLIITLAARHKLPAVYFDRVFVAAGGLISYGPDFSTSIAERPAMSTASSRARNRRTCRSGADQVRAGDQPEDREGARPRSPAEAALSRRRGDRIDDICCIRSRPSYGGKRTLSRQRASQFMSAWPSQLQKAREHEIPLSQDQT